MITPISRREGRPVISAITVTNGKTTVANATWLLMTLIGWRAASYDSTGITDVNGEVREAKTRRSPDYLPEFIDSQAHAGADAVSLEAYVGILADGLFDRVEVDVAVSTGLERDHIDVHGSIDGYWKAKLRLFEEYLRPDGIAVLGTDSAQGDLVRAAVARRGAHLITVGGGGEVRMAGVQEVDGQLRGRLLIGGSSYPAVLPTVHAIAATNLILAATAVIGTGGDPAHVAEVLHDVTPPPGRLQVIAEHDGITAMVDTAHNPGALRAALQAVRSRTPGRVILVFGAGGERDRGKRRPMGEVADQLADLVILTNDNPRREPADRIRREVREGVPGCIEVPARRDAILAALEMARPGDTVLVAGKGDENYQLVGRERVPHDDREIIRVAMARP